jgi:hypothetical protein
VKKILFLFLFSASFIYAYSQEYQFKRVFYEGNLVKMNGEITITDSSFILKYEGQKEFEYYTEGKFTFGQYFNVNLGTKEQEMRVMVTENTFNKNKGETHVFVMEQKDNFNNKIMKTLYYLIPK